MARVVRKVYGTKGRIAYSVGLPIPNRKKVFVTFEGGSRYPKFRPSKFTTTDPEVQNALESYSGFGKKYELLSTSEEVSEEVDASEVEAGGEESENNETEGKTEVKLKAFQNTSIDSAIATLVKQGWDGDADSLVTAEEVNEAALSIGISFPKIK